jgi:hypothetical protein
MMFMSPTMLEPTTASVAVYLLSRTTTLKRNIIQKRPLHYKYKFCKWVCKNKHTIADITIDEFADFIFDMSNNIHIYPNPTFMFLTYSILLIIFIIL